MNATTYPVEIDAPDIAPYRSGNTGIDWITTLEGARPGPHVLLSALVHGNELCGAIALDHLLRAEVRPLRGRLTLAFVNVAAYQRFDPRQPALSRFVDEDFNRLWTPEVLEGPRDSVELRRARELRPLLDEVDYLLDIHSMLHSPAPLMMAGPLEKGRALAREIGVPEHVVCDAGHAAGRRMRDYADFGRPESPRNALLAECGQHWRRATADLAVELAVRFLARFGMVDEGFVTTRLPGTPPPPQQVIEVTGPVTIESGDFRWAEDYQGLEVIARAGTVIGHDGDRPVRTPYDDCVLVMPSRRLRPGESAVRFGRLVGQGPLG